MRNEEMSKLPRLKQPSLGKSVRVRRTDGNGRLLGNTDYPVNTDDWAFVRIRKTVNFWQKEAGFRSIELNPQLPFRLTVWLNDENETLGHLDLQGKWTIKEKRTIHHRCNLWLIFGIESAEVAETFQIMSEWIEKNITARVDIIENIVVSFWMDDPKSFVRVGALIKKAKKSPKYRAEVHQIFQEYFQLTEHGSKIHEKEWHFDSPEEEDFFYSFAEIIKTKIPKARWTEKNRRALYLLREEHPQFWRDLMDAQLQAYSEGRNWAISGRTSILVKLAIATYLRKVDE